jgi:hypothetical protein
MIGFMAIYCTDWAAWAIDRKRWRLPELPKLAPGRQFFRRAKTIDTPAARC